MALLDPEGSFGVVYGDSSDGAVYVHKNDNDKAGFVGFCFWISIKFII